MRDAEHLVFVEVRYRASARFGDGAASVTASKRKKLIRAAGYYLITHPALARWPCRFDVVSVTKRNYRAEFDWIRNAFNAD